jgi:hypothetical protein
VPPHQRIRLERAVDVVGEPPDVPRHEAHVPGSVQVGRDDRDDHGAAGEPLGLHDDRQRDVHGTLPHCAGVG